MSAQLIDNLRSRLSSVGATLDDTDYSLHCDAPMGYVWKANDLTSFTIHYATNSQSWLAKAIKEEMPSLKMGLRLATAEEKEEIKYSHDIESYDASKNALEELLFS